MKKNKPIYKEKDLASVVRFFAESPSAISRTDPFGFLDDAGYSNLPLNVDEFEFYVNVAVEKTLIQKEEGAQLLMSEDGANAAASIGYNVTPLGYALVESWRYKSFWQSNIRQLRSNVVTIVISVMTSVATGWAVYFWGAPKP